MSEISARRRHSEIEEESYFVSMSDMLVGLLFVFVILLVYFAITFKQKEDYLVGAGEARKKLLKQLEKDIEQKLPGVDVVINRETGILRLPEEVLFESNEYELSPRGQAAIKTVAAILASRLPCYTKSTEPNGLQCVGPEESHRIDTLLVEGHTDADPIRGDLTGLGNLDLSARRATRTYLALTQAQPGLDKLTNGDSVYPTPVLGVAGYGPHRPVSDDAGRPLPQNTAPQKALHRRIDLRFIMVTPKRDAVQRGSKI
ncbi:OmpA family protein [Novosphingobium sp. Chol11]|uniref:OmpA/MotB family protein n=1 Tax=Novosphingobium sp. Chol11 TaxID=1385763 RepID=UPI0025FA5E78|nr:OmpA family protein [Novosphingobium sp. Chol11]